MKIGGQFLIVSALGALLAGCSSDGGILGSNLTTQSVDPAKPAVAAAKTDPACVALTAKIDALRKDGVTERAEKASVGKTATVNVKRDSLAKLSELDRANADYQSKCSAPGLAKPMMPAAAPPAPAAAPQKVSNAATTAKPAKAVQKAAAPAAAAPAPVAQVPAAAPAPAPVAVAPAPAPAAVAAPITVAAPQGVAPVTVTVPQPAATAPLPAAAAKAAEQVAQ